MIQNQSFFISFAFAIRSNLLLVFEREVRESVKSFFVTFSDLTIQFEPILVVSGCPSVTGLLLDQKHVLALLNLFARSL
jgi:hypothetical protein